MSFSIRTAFLAIAMVFIGLACSPGTGGRSVAITLALAGTDEPSFQNSIGWDVELTHATIALGPLYVLAPADELFAQLLQPFGPSRALAHAGTSGLDGRAVRGELLQRIELDALDPSWTTHATFGEEGPVDEISLDLVPSGNGVTAEVEGIAFRDGETIPFAGSLVLNADESPAIEGIPLDGRLDEGSSVQLRVDPRVWLDGVAFDRLEGTELHTVDSLRRAWKIGVQTTRAFSAQVQP